MAMLKTVTGEHGTSHREEGRARIADELQGCSVGQCHCGVTASHTVLPQVSWACPLRCEATDSQNLE